MDSKTSVTNSVPLDDESVFFLSVALAWYKAFPSELRKHTRLHFDRLQHSLGSADISPYGLLSAAYIGFAPLPTSYRRFITHARRINKLEPHPQSAVFRENDRAREISAAGEFGIRRDELKRLLSLVDELAERFIGVPTYKEAFNCEHEILNDSSPFAPPERETYAEGPLYLWDFAKAVSEHQLTNMHFGTFGGWVLFVHLEDGVVAGHAIHPVALRHGDTFENPFGFDIWSRMVMGFPTYCIDVPEAVEKAVEALANRCFPDSQFRLVPPPIVHAGQALPSWSGQSALRRHSAGG